MNPLKPFQLATVDHVLRQLTHSHHAGRFLVADEVGLGKTLVAKGVMQGLAEAHKQGPLRVFYVCSSLSIAKQNADELLRLPETIKASRVEVDRLTLLPTAKPSADNTDVQLFTLTPGTLPGATRMGHVDERALVLALLIRTFPELHIRKDGFIYRTLQDYAHSSFSWKAENAKGQVRGEAMKPFIPRFRASVRAQLNLTRGEKFEALAEHCKNRTLARMIRTRLEADHLDAVEQLRVALCRAALSNVRADLVIFDEFQRFFELLQQAEGATDEDDSSAARIMHSILCGDALIPPRVLLLSATPYRVYGSWRDGAHGQHHKEFHGLLRFLYGKTGQEDARAVKKLFDDYSRALRESTSGSVGIIEKKLKIENLLTKVMARTERTSDGRVRIDSRPEVRTIPLAPEDAFAFGHLHDSATTEKHMAASYWSSVPFPLQMMPAHDYKLSEHAKPKEVPSAWVGRATVEGPQVQQYKQLGTPHPRLRGLLGDIGSDLLKLPWLPPTLTWWPSEGIFESAERAPPGSNTPRVLSKALIFSRYRAVPRALSALLSFEAERSSYPEDTFDYHSRSSEQKPARGLKMQPQRAFNFSQTRRERSALMFFPHPRLAKFGDPRALDCFRSTLTDGKVSGFSFEQAVSEVVERLRATFPGEDAVSEGAPRRPLAYWASCFESADELYPTTLRGWRKALQSAEKDEAGGAEEAAASYPPAATLPQGAPSERELRELAEHALFAPGNALWRAVNRVFGIASPDFWEGSVSEITALSVNSLRNYLDAPEFHTVFGTSDGTYPARLRRAVYSGNFEAVLDEYLCVLGGLGNVSQQGDAGMRRALEEMHLALSIRAATVGAHSLPRSEPNISMRCHAAVPLGLRLQEERSEGKHFRSEYIRHAFNSPFRPHVLTTTSIGQEGLDFHRYCSHIIHWDLPSNPVDLEQRDGRINRFGGLNVRRAIVNSSQEVEPDSSFSQDESPWRALAERQTESGQGLSPWWTLPGAETRRTVYVAPFSRVSRELDELLDDLALYRFALGQADQERLLEALKRRIDGAGEDREALLHWLDQARINLAPGFRVEPG